MKYRVHVSREYIEYGDIEVDADSVMEAESKVEKYLDTGNTALFSWGEKELVGNFVEYTEELK